MDLGPYPLQNARFVLMVVTLVLAVIGSVGFKIAFRNLTPEQRRTNLGPRIYLAVLMVLWAGAVIGGLLLFRDSM